MAPAYPFTIDFDPPEPQSRLTVFFRLLLVIPHAIIVGLLGIATQVITLVAWFAILGTGKYPAGMQQFVVNVLHWQLRMTAYQYLLTGKYPPFALGADDSYPARLAGIGEIEGRNRLTVFFRLLMIIPSAIVLYIILIGVMVVYFISWFIALFTGSVPPGMHNFMAGGLRWATRLGVYAMLLTDQYPPFSLN